MNTRNEFPMDFDPFELLDADFIARHEARTKEVPAPLLASLGFLFPVWEYELGIPRLYFVKRAVK